MTMKPMNSQNDQIACFNNNVIKDKNPLTDTIRQSLIYVTTVSINQYNFKATIMQFTITQGANMTFNHL